MVAFDKVERKERGFKVLEVKTTSSCTMFAFAMLKVLYIVVFLLFESKILLVLTVL